MLKQAVYDNIYDIIDKRSLIYVQREKKGIELTEKAPGLRPVPTGRFSEDLQQNWR